MACDDCLGRTPFASLVATVIMCLGVGLFCGTFYRALEITIRGIFVDLFWFDVPWLETIQIVFVVVAVVMGIYSFILLFFGFLATGATRQKIYSGAKCIMGGRVSALFFTVMTYFLNLCWMGVTSMCATVILIYFMLDSICRHEYVGKPPWYLTYENCLNLSRFGIYRNYTEGVDRNAICDETDLSQFCQHVEDLGWLYGLAWGGSLLIVLGMVTFMITLSSNYNRIKISRELTEYRQAADLEMTDTTILEGRSRKAY